MKPSVQNIFRENYESYYKNNKLPLKAIKAANSIINCRTKELGGHVQECPEGHIKRIWYNSCKHRACRQCAGIQTENWLKRQEERILNTDHYHAIFTVPHKLNQLWLLNQKILTNVLFNCAKESLFGMMENEEFLGAYPGMIATLQTWGETLILHPHIHLLVTGGGLTIDGKWKKSKKGYLVPVKELMKIFRGKIIYKLRGLLYKGKLKIPNGFKYKELHNMLEKLKEIKWNVHISQKYAYGEGVIKYLARYIKGGPISNSRIVSIINKRVKFKYEDNRDFKNKKIIDLKTEEFIRRFFLHVPDSGLKVVRYFGLYSSSKREELNKCRRLMGQEDVKEFEKLTWQEYCESNSKQELCICPVCGLKLVEGEYFKNSFEFEEVKENIIRSGTILENPFKLNIA